MIYLYKKVIPYYILIAEISRNRENNISAKSSTVKRRIRLLNIHSKINYFNSNVK